MKACLEEIARSLAAILILAVLLCAVYPLAVWGVGRLFFADSAAGSLLERGGRTIGSRLAAQRFDSPAYFRPRPSAVEFSSPQAASGGSNLGPLSRALARRLAREGARYRSENGLPPAAVVPGAAVCASASGLDPHISPADAAIQSARVARARGWSRERVLALVRAATENRQLGIFGEERINVLLLNLALDASPDRL
jgi:K+-transporting ATPase ATPase C chain